MKGGAMAALDFLHSPGKLAKGVGILGALKAPLLAIFGSLSTFFTIAAPLAVVIGMLVGTFRVLKDTTNEATQFLMTSFDELMIALDTIAYQFGSDGGFVESVMKFVDWLGTGVVGVLGIGVKIVERVTTAFSWLFAVIKGIGLGIGNIITKIQEDGFRAAFDPSFVKKAFSSGMDQAMQERREAERKAYLERQKREKKKKEEEEADGVAAGGAKPPEVNVTIQQTITTDANPDRIAFRVGEVIGDVAKKFPRSVAGVGAR